MVHGAHGHMSHVVRHVVEQRVVLEDVIILHLVWLVFAFAPQLIITTACNYLTILYIEAILALEAYVPNNRVHNCAVLPAIVCDRLLTISLLTRLY